MSHSSKKETIEGLRRQVNGACGKRRSDLLNRLGDRLKEQGRFDDAVKSYEQGAKLSEEIDDWENATFNHRSLAEIFAQQGERAPTNAHLDGFERSAGMWKNHAQMQLAKHVRAWCGQQLYIHGPCSDENLLKEALRNTEESEKLLTKYRTEINSNQEEVGRGGNCEHRRANLRRLQAELHGSLHCPWDSHMEEAEKALSKAFAYCDELEKKNRSQALELKYTLLRVQLDFDWMDGEEVARKLLNVGRNLKDNKKKADAKYWLAQKTLTKKYDISTAKELFYELLMKESKDLSTEDQEQFSNIFQVFKLERRQELFRKYGIDSKRQRIYAEKLGDMLAEENMDLMAVDYYERMLLLSETVEQRRAAYQSLAETCKELKKWKAAEEYFDKLLEIERQIGDDEHLDTENCLFSIRCDGNVFKSCSNVRKEIDRLEKRPKTGGMISVYEPAIRYFRRNQELDLVKQFERKLSVWNDEHSDMEDISWTAPVLPDDEMDKISDSQVLQLCTAKAKQLDAVARAKAEKDKVINGVGETRLHLAAKNDDSEELVRLLKLGYNVNATDNAGWTPLSEAVSAGLVANTLKLIQFKANVDCVSKEGLETGEDESTGQGMTPLMEACCSSNVQLINLLLGAKANVCISNKDGWTAADFLYYTIHNSDIPSVGQELQQILTKIQLLQSKAGYPVRQGAPPQPLSDRGRALKAGILGRRVKARQRRSSPNERNLNTYRNVMEGIGSRTKTNEAQLNNALLDVEEKAAESDNSFYNEPDYVDIEDPPSPPLRKTKKMTAEVERRSGPCPIASDDEEDEPIEKSATRKRRREDTEENEAPPKRNGGTRRSFSPYSVRSVDSARSGHSRSSRLSPPHDHLPLHLQTPSTSVDSRSSPRAETITVRVEFGYVGSDAKWRGPKLKGVPRNETVKWLSTKLQSELGGRDHTWMLADDGIDDTLTVSQLVDIASAPGPLTLSCRLTDSTMMAEYERNADEADKGGILLQALNKFDHEGILDVRDPATRMSTEIAFWKALAKGRSGSNAGRISIFRIENWDKSEMGAEEGELIGRMAKDAEELSLARCRIPTETIAAMAKELAPSASLRSIDLSFNPEVLTSKVLVDLLCACPKLSSVVLSGTFALEAPHEVLRKMAGMVRLERVVVSHCPWMDDSSLALLAPPSTRISTLNLSVTSIVDFRFEMEWGARLSSLSLSNCRLSPSSWQSLSEWLRGAESGRGARALRRMDLSDTMVPLYVVEAAATCPRGVETDLQRCPQFTISHIREVIAMATTRATWKVRVNEEMAEEMRRKHPAESARFLK